MSAEDNLRKAWESINWAEPTLPEYRIYYDVKTGNITNYTNEKLPGSFIIVSREVFAEHRFDLKVQNGKLSKPKPSLSKLVPSAEGISCHPRDITVIDCSTDSIKWKIQTYEQD